MPTGVALADLRKDLLAETKQSLNPAHGVNTLGHYNHILKRTQEEQWLMFAWPHLRLFKTMDLNAGQRFYDYPPGLPFENIERIWRQESVDWFNVEYGITPAHYSIFGGEDGRSWPIQRWRNSAVFDEGTGLTNPDAQFEVWPVPSMNGKIRIEGQAPLNPLIADTDACTLDSNLIVLFAAAEILAGQKAEDASLKLQKAQQYQRKLLTKLGGVKSRAVSLSAHGGSMDRGRRGLTPYLDYIPMKG